MTDVMKAIILGIIEGLTEFLPVSSTGHLILAGHLLSFEGQTAITFKIVIQLGAVMAVLLLYWKRYLAIGANLIRMDFSPSKGLNVIHMMLAMLPALILYLLFKDTIKSQLFGPIPVLIGLVAGGLLMIIAARSRRTETAETMDRIHYKQAFGIGLFQCLALWPGFSRSGSTISGGLLLGTSQKAAADFTFLISVPVMFGASVLDLYDSRELLDSDDLFLMAIGFMTSFLVAMIAVVTFIKLIKRLRLEWFALYRFVLAGLFYLIVLQ
ncbi:undecaprenol kinase [Paenibacillus vortex V453]|jgi:undecaprenyl-diphosphatase|uniref:Undecaprenyl-diphosphatase n=2 Tax=Paenibacillus TaxID=44249 RepID=A0A163DKV3_9BACL|nr:MULTISPECIES: undecaprenyl-diphosphate phosphatase [Paenibacillus]MCA4752257.1 undecaprenyl-diphosphate phosphatase [Mycolicibacterium fortuitum]AVV58361.1 undecaprenyl-diphosphate phosphatase [Paenibacillus glucanolyticus]AWP27522.1 undecaprenyl-diphosphatase [Paenibacillus sp. Cedars]EFU40717.1 undecaprenol kinase [Paenibacillus vortex V453]ETT42578.1 undecaprenyl pyrophosphate phosphatase [Paenibacillus sp. FSL R5-808]